MGYGIYIAGTNDIPADGLDRMSACRKEKANTYKCEQDKQLCILSTILLDRALKKYGFAEKDMEYTKNEYGKPCFLNAPWLHFSISHSGDYAMVVLSEQEIGCDIQQIRDIHPEIVNRFFSPAEQEYVQSERDIFKIWTMKESLIKAVGKGLAIPLSAFTIEGLDTEMPYCEYEGEKYVFTQYDEIKQYCIAVCEKEMG